MQQPVPQKQPADVENRAQVEEDEERRREDDGIQIGRFLTDLAAGQYEAVGHPDQLHEVDESSNVESPPCRHEVK